LKGTRASRCGVANAVSSFWRRRHARRVVLVCPAMLLAAGLSWSVAITSTPAEADPGVQGVSQGSIATHPYVDVSEGPSPGYSQVVDNSTEGRFEASGWRVRSGDEQSYGGDYAYAQPSEDGAPARFKVTIPATGYYTIYARWPADAGNSAATRFGVSTTSGVRWTQVNQQEDGGMWVRLGAYKMKAGDSYAVQVSGAVGSDGEAVADAVIILSGEQANPEQAESEEATERGVTVAGGRASGRDVVRVARRHIGTPYRASPPHRCKAFRSEDCSCHTKVVFKRFGKHLRDDPPDQWKKGKRIRKKSHLRPGDLVFFDENKNGKLQPWDHVAIYSGNGNVIHASSYFGEVVESKMKYIRGYWGARRLRGLR
jgi:cell wall-associated NlpC family hydrolase